MYREVRVFSVENMSVTFNWQVSCSSAYSCFSYRCAAVGLNLFCCKSQIEFLGFGDSHPCQVDSYGSCLRLKLLCEVFVHCVVLKSSILRIRSFYYLYNCIVEYKEP